MKITREKDKNLGSWIWRADFTYKRKRYRPSAVKKDDLEELITQLRSNADRKKVGLNSRAPKIALKQLFDEHIREFDLSKKTHRRGKVVLEGFVKHLGEDAIIEEIKISDMRSFVRWRKDTSKLQPESVNKEIGYASSMLRNAPKYFKSLDSYKPPPMPWEKVPKNSAQRVIYKDEREALIAYMRYDGLHPNEKPISRNARFEYADMFEIAYHTAMRWGEVAPLEWAMIDFRKAELRLPTDTKTGESRTVYLNSRAMEILRLRHKRHKYVFPGNAPDTHRKYYYEGIRRAAKKIGLPFGRDVGFTLHSSRHSAITEILHATGDFAAAQAASGHTEAVMTLKYAHTTKKRVHTAVETLVVKPEK